MTFLFVFLALFCTIGAHLVLRRITDVGIVAGFAAVTAAVGLTLLATLVWCGIPIAETISALFIFAFGCELRSRPPCRIRCTLILLEDFRGGYPTAHHAKD